MYSDYAASFACAGGLPYLIIVYFSSLLCVYFIFFFIVPSMISALYGPYETGACGYGYDVSLD